MEENSVNKFLKKHWKIISFFLFIIVSTVLSIILNRPLENSYGVRVFGTDNVCFGQNIRDGLESGFVSELIKNSAKVGSEQIVKSISGKVFEQNQYSKTGYYENLYFYLGAKNDTGVTRLYPKINCIYAVLYDLEEKSTIFLNDSDLQYKFDTCSGKNCNIEKMGVIGFVSFSFEYDHVSKLFSFGAMCTEGFDKTIMLKTPLVQVIGTTLDDEVIFHGRATVKYSKGRMCGSEHGRMWFKRPNMEQKISNNTQSLLPINIFGGFD